MMGSILKQEPDTGYSRPTQTKHISKSTIWVISTSEREEVSIIWVMSFYLERKDICIHRLLDCDQTLEKKSCSAWKVIRALSSVSLGMFFKCKCFRERTHRREPYFLVIFYSASGNNCYTLMNLNFENNYGMEHGKTRRSVFCKKPLDNCTLHSPDDLRLDTKLWPQHFQRNSKV